MKTNSSNMNAVTNFYPKLNVLIFSTNIQTKEKVKSVNLLFEKYPTIKRWTVDTQDVDNVLRVEALHYLLEQDVIDLLTTRGFSCDILRS